MITLWDGANRSSTGVLAGSGSCATCVAFGPGGTLASGSDDDTVRLWNIRGRRITAVVRSDGETRTICVAVNPDGRTVAAGGTKLTVWTIT
jgi:WD40 repeat protein